MSPNLWQFAAEGHSCFHLFSGSWVSGDEGGGVAGVNSLACCSVVALPVVWSVQRMWTGRGR